MDICEIDLETRSRVDLTEAGAHVYANHPSTAITVAAYAFNHEDVELWWPGTCCPSRIVDHVRRGGEIRGWNVGFERQMWAGLLEPVHGWPLPRLEQFSDNAALGAAMGLPRKLEDAAMALGLEEQKDVEGHRLMLRMSKPNALGGYLDDIDSLIRLASYCAQDVRTSRAVRRKLKPLTPFERKLWLLDQMINDRGVAIDLELVEALTKIVNMENQRLNALICEATSGKIGKITQTVALARWISSQGIPCDSLAKERIPELLKRDLPESVRAAIEIRYEGSKSSTTKLSAARRATSDDGRARGMLLFNGASTGRWAGRLLQPQNMVRGSGLTRPDLAIPFLKTADYEAVQYCYPWPLQTVADCMRGVMVAGQGLTLLAGDYSTIEARITAWFGRFDAKLAQFVKADRGEGPGMYELQAAGIYGVPVAEIDHEDPRRQTGKTAELALGFGGGVAALEKMGKNYNIDLADTYASMVVSVDRDKLTEVVDKCHQVFKRGNSGGLSEKAWIACELIKQAWRRSNQPIVDSWKTVDDAAWHAMHNPGKVVMAKGGVPLGWQWEGGFLQLLLPSGRRLYYGDPKVREVEVPWSDKTVPKLQRERKLAVTVKGIDSITTRFVRYPLYPGLGIQHATQATARDLLGNGMLNAEAEGFPIVLTVHDEAIAEIEVEHVTPESLNAFLSSLCRLPDWGKGIPLIAEGWIGPRYHKA
jgi:DNA polymerase bacteriophage-type